MIFESDNPLLLGSINVSQRAHCPWHHFQGQTFLVYTCINLLTHDCSVMTNYNASVYIVVTI